MIGVRYDLMENEAVFKGADWYHDFQLILPAGVSAVGFLAGASVSSQARKPVTGETLTFTGSIPDPEGLIIRIALPVQQNVNAGSGFYNYDVEVATATHGVIKAILPSKIQVVGENTRG